MADDQRAWVLDGRRAIPLPLGGVEQIGRDGDTIVATRGRCSLRLDLGTLALRRVDHGRERAVPGGAARVWIDDEAGFAYRAAGGRIRAVDVVGERERVAVGPHGALLAGRSALTRGGAPGRTPRPLTAPLSVSPLRWSPDGRSVAGLTAEDERPIVIDLDSGEPRPGPDDGIPVAHGTWLRDGRIVRGTETLLRGITEASAARWDTWLAGPGGWIWCLREARPVQRHRVIALGATAGTPEGFVTVDWETGQGWTAPFSGGRSHPFALPMDPDDTVIGSAWADGAVHVRTALGEGFSIHAGQVARSDVELPEIQPRTPSPVQTPAGPFAATVDATVEGARFVCDDDGWLLAWPEDVVYGPETNAPRSSR